MLIDFHKSVHKNFPRHVSPPLMTRSGTGVVLEKAANVVRLTRYIRLPVGPGRMPISPQNSSSERLEPFCLTFLSLLDPETSKTDSWAAFVFIFSDLGPVRMCFSLPSLGLLAADAGPSRCFCFDYEDKKCFHVFLSTILANCSRVEYDVVP